MCAKSDGNDVPVRVSSDAAGRLMHLLEEAQEVGRSSPAKQRTVTGLNAWKQVFPGEDLGRALLSVTQLVQEVTETASLAGPAGERWAPCGRRLESHLILDAHREWRAYENTLGLGDALPQLPWISQASSALAPAVIGDVAGLRSWLEGVADEVTHMPGLDEKVRSAVLLHLRDAISAIAISKATTTHRFLRSVKRFDQRLRSDESFHSAVAANAAGNILASAVMGLASIGNLTGPVAVPEPMQPYIEIEVGCGQPALGPGADQPALGSGT